MSLIVLTSASGSPGVTTTAVAMALAWPRSCLLVEADMSGGSPILAGYLRGSVPHDRGLIDVAMAHRRGALHAGLLQASLPLGISTTARLVPGLSTSAQASALAPVSEHLAVTLLALENTGTDVIVDAGRAGLSGSPHALLRAADLVLLVTGTRLPSVVSLPGRVEVMRDELENRGAGADSLGLLVVGDGRPYRARELSKLTGLPTIGTLPWDPGAAAVFSDGVQPARRRAGISRLSRTAGHEHFLGQVREVVADVGDRVGVRRQRLSPTATAARGVAHG